MKKVNNIKLVPTQEIQSVILQMKAKINNHLEMSPSNQVNEGFIGYMESNIQELNEVLKQRKVT